MPAPPDAKHLTKILKQQLQLSEKRFHTLAKICPLGIFQCDVDGKITFSNEMWSFFTGGTDDQPYWFSAIDEQEHDTTLRCWQKDRERFSCCSYECTFTQSGESFLGLLQISKEMGADGELLGYIGTLTDISVQKEYQNNIEKLSYYDPLTKLANRQLFRDRLERGMKSSSRNQNKLAVLNIDIDNFKRINESVGLDGGDIIINTTAKRISACVREQDTVARTGGDEFSVCLANLENSSRIAQIANQIVQAISEPINVGSNEIIITASVGIAMLPNDGDSYESLTKCAELAMYNVKEKGHNNFQFFSPLLNSRASERLSLESDLRHALHDNQFYICYQPKFDISSGAIFGVEALVRWKHPERGEIRPDEFIYVAEQMGQIVALGKYVMQKSCQDLHYLREKHLVDNKFCVSVNLSVKQFQTLSLLHTVVTSLFDADLPGFCLDLEITESLIMENLDQAIEMLHCMKSHGVTISIDDFGTGYSSLGYLKKLPVNTVKIDRSFVRDIPDDEGNTSIVGAIIAMSHKLNLNVVAEGIETNEQLDALYDLGCDHGQGYLISKPIILDELEQLLLKQQTTQLNQAQGAIKPSQSWQHH